ncbi:MAG: hypothetical protein B7X11_00095 [Acidobacteria bacterium 37-65-4]|nr:MAG: hypothetical protein B7X11_00095 [Acidobacteria bacterium 37-65-4]
MARKLILISVVASLVLAASLVWAGATNDHITQGDFAALLASNLKAPVPAGGWTASNAPAFLTDIGLSPMSGAWNGSEMLNDGDLVHMLRQMGQPFYSAEPDSIVTWGRAYAVLAQFQDFFRTYLANRTASNDTTTHIYTGMGSTAAGAVAPASPATP